MKSQSSFKFFICLWLAAATTGLVQGATKTSTTNKGNGWSGATGISPICQPDPTRGSQLNDVAVNASGLAIAAWDQYTYNNGGGATIGAAVQSGGKWGAPFTISGTTGFSMSPKVAVGADGTMAVSWIYEDPITGPSPQQKVQVAVKAAGASSWVTTTLAQGTIGGVAITSLVPVAVDANGNVIAAWTLWDGTIHLVQSATMVKGGGWSAPLNLAPGLDGLYLSLAINARGDAAVAFTISPYSSYLTGTSAHYVFRSSASGTWTAPRLISETLSSSIGYISSPMVALDSNGRATVAYFGPGVEIVRQLDDIHWTSPKIVLSAPNSVSSFQSIDLSADQNGNGLLAASIFDATINVDRASVWVAMGKPDGSWSTPQRLTDPTIPIDAYAARAAVSPDGGLVLAGWIDHYHGTVQVSRLDNGIWSAANTIDRGTAFSSFQEILGLEAASSTVARAVWKSAKTGTQTIAASFGK